jgi:hypothetical protein
VRERETETERVSLIQRSLVFAHWVTREGRRTAIKGANQVPELVAKLLESWKDLLVVLLEDLRKQAAELESVL